MIIRRSKNGTYSITDMTRDDLDNLAFGACSAVAFHANDHSGMPEWNAKQGCILTRLERQLRRVLPRYDGTPSESRVVVISDGFDVEDAYQEVSK